MSLPRISVVLPTRNPHPDRLTLVLQGLSRQTLPTPQWELCVVDNGSMPPLRAPQGAAHLPMRITLESRPGLLWARLCGIQHTSGENIVFIDDDTVPADAFLATAVAFMDAHPQVGTAGGKILPHYQATPPPWIDTVAWLLALRDSGLEPLEWNIHAGTPLPNWTPIGAGLLMRRAALVPSYLRHVEAHAEQIERISWRSQNAGGVEDKDMVLHCLRTGWSTAYVPGMVLTHLIPAERLQFSYFAKLLPTVQRMWMQTLQAPGFEFLPPIHPATLPLRKAKAWFSFQAWRSPARKLDWLASCGCLDGLAANYTLRVRYAASDGPHQTP